MAFPTTRELISKAESELGTRLPAALVDHLQRKNGGVVTVMEEGWRLFPVFDASDQSRAKRTAGHVIAENKSARSWAGFPSAAVAIAASDYGDYLVLLPNPHRTGELGEALQRWDHETGELLPVEESLEAALATAI